MMAGLVTFSELVGEPTLRIPGINARLILCELLPGLVFQQVGFGQCCTVKATMSLMSRQASHLFTTYFAAGCRLAARKS